MARARGRVSFDAAVMEGLPMVPCISQVTTLPTPFEEDIPALARAGWPAVELWLTKLETFLEAHSIGEARKLLADHDFRPLAAAGQGGLLLADGPERALRWQEYLRRLESLAALGVPTLVVAADHVASARPEDYGRAVAGLTEAAEAARGAGIRLALEFQRSSGLCASLDTALALVAQADVPGLGVCLDLFHYYTGPSKFEDLAYLTRENLAWVQVCDLGGTPREVASDSDRILPGEGDFAIGPILEQLVRIGYDGGVSAELLNPLLWRVPIDSLADAARRALLRTLGPIPPVGGAAGA
jgi:sugar phosphate isomerase/epimerase